MNIAQLCTARQELLWLHFSLGAPSLFFGCSMVLPLPSLYSVSPHLQKRPFCDVQAPLLWPLSFGSHPWASSALIQHHRPRLHDVRANKCHHLPVCYHHHVCCVPRLESSRRDLSELHSFAVLRNKNQHMFGTNFSIFHVFSKPSAY